MFGYLYPADEQLVKSLDNTVRVEDYDLMIEWLPPVPHILQELDQQILSFEYVVDRDIVDAELELIILPIIAWDAPDHTPYQTWQVNYDDVDLVVIWPTPQPPPQLTPRPASVIIMSRKQRYMVSKAAMTDALGIELVQYPKGVPLSYDNDSDNQMLQSDYYKDVLADEDVELIQYGKGIITAHDFEVDHQLQWLGWTKDHLSDEGIELITITAVWDTDTEQQFRQLDWRLDQEEERQGDPHFTIPIQAYDTDADKQLKQLDWNLDYEASDIVQFQFVPVAYDADEVNQLQNIDIPWINDYEDFDLYQEIFPVIIIVPLLYKLSTNVEVLLGSLTTFAEMQLYKLSTTLSKDISSFTVNTEMDLYKLTTQPSMLMSSFTIHGAS